MSRVIALVPARAGSKGIPNKNFRLLAGECPASRAVWCASHVADPVILTTGGQPTGAYSDAATAVRSLHQHVIMVKRPDELATDEAPMLAVVQHALEQIPGEPDDLILLVQPTQPLRQPKHLIQAIELLRETQADSVVSVVELPLLYSPDLLCEIHPGLKRLQLWGNWPWNEVTRRQDANPAYRRDGTVYAFWRKTLDSGTFYGRDCRPLIIPSEETCSLDTPEDWVEAERRLRERQG